MTMDGPPDPKDPPPRRRKHLIDLNNPRPPQRSSMSLNRVQQWVASSVIFIVGMGITIPLAGISPFMGADEGAPGAAVGLWVMSLLWGVATVVAILVVHRHRVLSPWLLLGIVPAMAVLPLML